MLASRNAPTRWTWGARGAALLALLSCRGGTAPPPAPQKPPAAAFATLADWRALPVFRHAQYEEQSSEARATRPTNPDKNNFICKSADARVDDRQDVPFIYDLPACPDSYVHGVVLARFDGPGRLARIWLTMSGLKDGQGTPSILRIYVDDDPTPVVDAPLAAVLDGSADPMFAPPFGAGSTSYLAWYYPLAFRRRLVVALDNLTANNRHFYQSAVVKDDPPGVDAGASASAGVDDARATLGAVVSGAAPGAFVFHDEATLTLAPGETATVVDARGPGTLQKLSLRAAPAGLAALDAVTVTATWDDSAAPALDLSLAALFASALDLAEGKTLALARSDAAVDLRLPMPFAQRALIRVRNDGPSPVSFALLVAGDDPGDRRFLPVPPGRLHAQYHQTLSPATSPSHPIAHAVGPGRLVGVCAMLEGHGPTDRVIPFLFLEGNLNGQIDGRVALRGTGTEDYFNGAYYFRTGSAATAFAAWWGVRTVAKSGVVSTCRWHVLGDAIDFENSLDVDLEIGPHDATLLDRYRTVAFLYQ